MSEYTKFEPNLICENCKCFCYYTDWMLYCKKHYGGSSAIILPNVSGFKCGMFKPNKYLKRELKKYKKESKKK